MNRSDLVKVIVEREGEALRALMRDGATPRQIGDLVEQVVDAFLDTLALSLACEEPVTIYGFGKFEHRIRAGRAKRHPGTGDLVQVPDRATVVFSAAPPLKARVNAQ